MPLKWDPEFEAAAGPMLKAMASAPKPELHDIQGRRAAMVTAFGPAIDRLPQPTVTTTKHLISSYDGAEIVLYQHQKPEPSPSPTSALIHIHGGGMIAGSAQFFAKFAAGIAATTGVPVFAIEYRLAPEHPDPAPIEDCYAAVAWVHSNAKTLNIDPARIAVYGESAGGGLAAGVALMARDRQLHPPLAKQILVYPMLDCRVVKSSAVLEPFLVWNATSNITGWTALLGDRLGTDKVSPYASPALAKSVADVAPAYIDLGSLDLFRDEDLEYAHRLAVADVDVELHTYPGVPHAFEFLAPSIYLTKQAIANRLRVITGI